MLALPIGAAYAAPSSESVATINAWTLAAVPQLSQVSAQDLTYTLKISSTNATDTNMQIEKSIDEKFSSPVVIEEWKEHSNGDQFDVVIQKDEATWYRIKARNRAGVETEYSTALKLEYKAPEPEPKPEPKPEPITLTKPIIESSKTEEESIAFFVSQVPGAIAYKARRSGNSQVTDITSNRSFLETELQPGQPYTYDVWVEANGVKSEILTETFYTKTLDGGFNQNAKN
ncbi:hypothetical protein EEL31_23145 [Brevibacillus laterosporus]|nr:hypothetical protein [Brevibacillus laterosporus]TPG71040.1 hypothetical protein EEL31_23145 [Brevibacillus laterosporus]